MQYKIKKYTPEQVKSLPAHLKEEYEFLKDASLDFDPDLLEAFADNDTVLAELIDAELAKAKPEPKEDKIVSVRERPAPPTPQEKAKPEPKAKKGGMIETVHGLPEFVKSLDGDGVLLSNYIVKNDSNPRTKYGASLGNSGTEYFDNLKDAIEFMENGGAVRMTEAMQEDQIIAHKNGVNIYRHKDGYALSKDAKPWGGFIITEMGGSYQHAVKKGGQKGFYLLNNSLKEIAKLLERPKAAQKATGKSGGGSSSWLETVKPILKELSEKDPDMSRKEVLQYAFRVSNLRPFTAVINDDMKKAKNVLEPTYTNLLRWIVNPSRYDIQGVDIGAAEKATIEARVKPESFFKKIGLRGL